MSNTNESLHKEVAEIKAFIQRMDESQRRLEQGLMGSIVEGRAIPGLFEQVRKQGDEIEDLKGHYKTVVELNTNIEKLYRWKYMVVGMFLVSVFILDKVVGSIWAFFDGLLNHK